MGKRSLRQRVQEAEDDSLFNRIETKKDPQPTDVKTENLKACKLEAETADQSNKKSIDVNQTIKDDDVAETKATGPQRMNKNIRVSTRIDYQPYLCKDYNETGYCGFGDSCIYVHDRGDYKSSWELDKEWEEAKTKSGTVLIEPEVVKEPVQTKCPICEKEFSKSIVRASCGHLFCELCAVQRFLKDKRCITCNEALSGQFKKASLSK